MNFDEIINRKNTHSAKWDMMEELFGVSKDNGIPMWVADMDFRPPKCISESIKKMYDHGVYGYFGDDKDYLASIKWWMKTRHNWDIDLSWIFTTHGLVNGTSMAIQTYSDPGDGVVLFTPIYYVFFKQIKEGGREVLECPLVNNKGHYELDFEYYDSLMKGNEKVLVLSSPHNPGGRVWTQKELTEIASFAQRHDLVVVSDEIHNDLIMPGYKHIPMAIAAPQILDRLVMMTATTKTFNIAGMHTGNVIIPDPKLRAAFNKTMVSFGISPSSFGKHMITAAYSQEGADWVDNLMLYLDENQKIFNTELGKIPGINSMHLESTYLCWVDFSNTGMSKGEFTKRVEKTAQIAASHGHTFGAGGEKFLRFNIATRRTLLLEALERLNETFSDLQ
ncbi:MAG: pyridoxal phosphate-dependent aminotransferase [Rhodobacteraceae bacterium]|nr:pyridoxal phosphate-dependent aminotransferase [Paracoccaceae bacterium]